MAKHYTLRAEPVEIKADPTLWRTLKTAAKQSWSSVRFQLRRMLRLKAR